MGSLRKKTFTKPLPAEAELFQRKGQQFAQWVDAKGKKKTAPTSTGKGGVLRIVVESRFWLAKYRDGSGLLREIATGCKDRAAAQTKLTDLERRAELIRSGVVTESQESIAGHLATPLAQHITDYMTHLKGRSGSQKHRSNVHACLERLAAECGFRKLSDLKVGRLEQWLLDAEQDGLGPRTRNRYRSAIVAFCGWCVSSERLLNNPLKSLPVANEKTDRRRLRRALNEAEIGKLFDAAERRPLLEAMTIRRGRDAGKPLANVKPHVRERLIRLGRERRLIYLVLLSTGLRKAELQSVHVHQVILDSDWPGIELSPDDEKNSEGSFIPLRNDVADELRSWLADRRSELAEQNRLKLDADPQAPLSAELLFHVPDSLDKVFNKDIELAGIAKRDDRSRVVDIHALRTTFCSMLQKAGVAPRVAQEAMRHSDIRLTMATYTDPKLLDIAGAVESLPTITGSHQRAETVVLLTGTDNNFASEGEAQAEAPSRLSVIHCDVDTSDSASLASQASGGGSIPLTRFERASLSATDNEAFLVSGQDVTASGRVRCSEPVDVAGSPEDD
ncbi:MAG: tyrosine-type recombinase/integrase [Planctomycetaceae bacterium]|nr:tyrosine-type recombinase/integrase [Planctomycetaceae bacterium]